MRQTMIGVVGQKVVWVGSCRACEYCHVRTRACHSYNIRLVCIVMLLSKTGSHAENLSACAHFFLFPQAIPPWKANSWKPVRPATTAPWFCPMPRCPTRFDSAQLQQDVLRCLVVREDVRVLSTQPCTSWHKNEQNFAATGCP